MKRSASLIILVAGTLFASCSSLQTISFDQLQAADVSFPDAVRKVAVINNMPVLKTKDNHEILSWKAMVKWHPKLWQRILPM